MFPDAKWLDALKLPAKSKVAIALVCGALLLLFKEKLLSVGKPDQTVETLLLIGAVVFGILTIVDGAVWLAHPLTERRRLSTLTTRRAARKREQEAARAESRAAILAQLDHLSLREIQVIARALREGSPTFYTYVHSPPVTMLQAKRLAWTPGGPHNQDHYPFTIADFVWDELLRRRDEFLGRERAGAQAAG